jgi:hypothetical protein
MTQIVPTNLGQAAITVSVTTLYTVPVGVTTFLKDVEICNTSSSVAIQVTVYLVPNGSTPSTSNEFVPSSNILPNGMFQWTGAIVMNAGASIQIVASSTGCNIYASGGEYK